MNIRGGSVGGFRGLLAACGFTLLLACGGTAQEGYMGLDGVAWDDFTPFQSLWLEDELAEHPELTGATRYHLRLDLSDDLKSASASLSVRYSNRGEDAVAELPFFCYPNLTAGALEVASVVVEGSPTQPQRRNAGSLLIVPLPEPLQPGQRVTIAVEYTLRVPTLSSGDSGLFVFGDGVLSLAYAYPMIPARRAWQRGFPPRYGDFVANEVAFYVVEVSAPDDVVLALPGVELARRRDGGRTEVLFALGPARDLFLAASRDFVVLEEKGGAVRVRSLAPRSRVDGARLVLTAAGEALESFARRFGPYPFTTLTVVAAPFGALGMEFPGITLLALRLYDLEGDINGLSHRILLEATLAHEVAHQWFYNSVGNDQLEEPWIDESLAQYASWLYYRDRYGDGGARGMFREFDERWDRVDRAPIPIGKPVGAYSPKEYGAIIYGRAPLFLHALSERMGEESFDRLLSELAARFEWRLVEGRELMRLAEEICQCELDDLWLEWVDPDPQSVP
jgi:aminopeptidase N